MEAGTQRVRRDKGPRGYRDKAGFVLLGDNARADNKFSAD